MTPQDTPEMTDKVLGAAAPDADVVKLAMEIVARGQKQLGVMLHEDIWRESPLYQFAREIIRLYAAASSPTPPLTATAAPEVLQEAAQMHAAFAPSPTSVGQLPVPPVEPTPATPGSDALWDADLLKRCHLMLVELHESIRKWARGDGHPNNMTNDGLAYRVQKLIAETAAPASDGQIAEIEKRHRKTHEDMRPEAKFLGFTHKDWMQAHCDRAALLAKLRTRGSKK